MIARPVGSVPPVMGSDPDAAAVLELAGSAGAPVWGPVEREWGGFTGYFADPDGFRWEVAWNPGPIGLRAVPDTDVDARP